MKEHITWQSLQKKKLIKRKNSDERRKEFNDHPVCQCFLCWLNSWILLLKERRHCLTGLSPGARWLSRTGDGSPPAATTCVTSAAEERREGGVPPWLPVRSASDPKHKWVNPLSPVQLPVLVMSMELLDPLEEEPRAFHWRCLILLQQPVPRSCGAVGHLWERLWKSYCCSCLEWWSGEGSHTASWIFITKTKALVLSPPPFLCTSNPPTINNNVRKRGADRDKPVWLQLVRERFGYEVLSAKALPLHFLNQLLILP